MKPTHNQGRPHRTQPRSKSNRPGSVPYAAARWLPSRDLQRSRFYWSLSSGGNTLTLLDNTIFTELSSPLLIRTLPVYLATVNKCWKLVEGLTDHPQKHDSFCRDVPFGQFLLLPRLQSPLLAKKVDSKYITPRVRRERQRLLSNGSIETAPD